MSTHGSDEIKNILNIFLNSKAGIRPHFMLAGPSGSGKTFTIKTLLKRLKIPLFEVNAAQLTKEGTSGNSLSKAMTPLLTIGDRYAALPTLDERSDDEILGYDEHGLPA